MGENGIDHAIDLTLRFIGRAWTVARLSLIALVLAYVGYIVVDLRSSSPTGKIGAALDVWNRIASDFSGLFSNFRLFRLIGDAFGNIASLGELNPSLFMFLSSVVATVGVLFCLCG
jgi:hypothetical protein